MHNLILGVPLIIAGSACFSHFQNNCLKTTKLNIKTSLKENINIIQLSDLHSKEFGKSNIRLYNHIASLNPHIIFLTGDIIDSSLKNMDEIILFIGSLKSICTVVYIPGNNENRTNKIDYIITSLKNLGVYTLKNEFFSINVNGEKINILGLSEGSKTTSLSRYDKIFHTYHHDGYESLLKRFEKMDGYKILLSHYPEKFSLKGDYHKYGFDLMLAGHAHGGQFILPFVGGLFAPGQGILPKFYGGLYKSDKNSLVVSRGLGNSGFPLRLFNRPDVVKITLLKSSTNN